MTRRGPAGRFRALPLAITAVDGSEGCVGALTAGGRWVRPEPVALADVLGEGARYVYGRWLALELAPSAAADARPEDGRLVAAPEVVGGSDPHELARLLRAHVDPDVQAAFADGRSLGLVRPRVHRAYLKRSTGRREHVRIAFADAAGATYDWIVPELRFCAWARERGVEAAADVLGAAETYFTVGLTKPNGRFPGLFGGCHPLIVGVHAISAGGGPS